MFNIFFKPRHIADRRATAAVEYALIAPLLILLGLGVIEFCAAVRAELAVDRASRVVAQLIQGQTSVTVAQMQDYLVAAQDVFGGTLGTLKISAASVVYTNQANGVQVNATSAVGWDAASGVAGYREFPTNMATTLAPITLSDTVDNDSAIVVQANARYALPFLPDFYGMIPTALSFSSTAIARPRNTLIVTKNGW